MALRELLSRGRGLSELAPYRLLLVALLTQKAGSVLLPFLALYLDEQAHLKLAIATAVVASVGAGGLVADYTITAVLKRLPHERAIFIALLLQAASLCVMALTFDPIVLIIMSAIWGYCNETVGTATFLLFTQSIEPSNLKATFTIFRIAINAGLAIAPIIGSVIYASGMPLLLFVVNIFAVLLAMLAVWIWARRNAGKAEHRVAAAVSWRGPWREEVRFLRFMITALPSQLALALPGTVLTLYLVGECGVSPLFAGVLLFINASMVIVIELPLSLAVSHLRNVVLIVIGLAFTGVGFAMVGFFHGTLLLLLSTVLWTVGFMITEPALPVHVREISTPQLLTRNVGIYCSSLSASILFVPLMYGVALRTIPGGIWTFVGALVFLSAAVFALELRRS